MISPERSQELLHAYTATRCGTAFRELAAGWSGMVHATALRTARGQEALAEDITQTVFSRLAAAPEKVRDARALGAWLHAAATGLTLDALRAESRRRRREEETSRQMMTHTTEPAAPDAVDGGHPLIPEIDGALTGLPPQDSQLLIMRFWQQRDWRSIGRALGLSDDAAQKRMGRALERLRRLLARRGITGTAGMLSAVLAGTVPRDLSAAAVLRIITASEAGLSPILTTAVMTTKTKAAIAALAAATAASLVYQQRRIDAQQEEIQSLRETSPATGLNRTPVPAVMEERYSARPAPAKSGNPPAAAEPDTSRPSGPAVDQGLMDFAAMNRGKLKEKLAVLRTRLSLTPEQEAQTAKALEYGQSNIKISPPNVMVTKAAPEDIKKMEEAIGAILNPAQRTEYESFRAEEKANTLEAAANRELSNLQSMMNLSQEQKDQAFAVFSEIAEKESTLPVLEPGGERESKAIEEAVNARWAERREALSAILTPEQMAVYHQAGSPYRRGAGG